MNGCSFKIKRPWKDNGLKIYCLESWNRKAINSKLLVRFPYVLMGAFFIKFNSCVCENQKKEIDSVKTFRFRLKINLLKLSQRKLQQKKCDIYGWSLKKNRIFSDPCFIFTLPAYILYFIITAVIDNHYYIHLFSR